jgi:hypothetical protein
MYESADHEDAPVLVVVVNHPDDLARAREQGWYRIPLAQAPRRVAAEYLAFYQTAAFPAEERWAVRWLAPVQGYHIATRRELIPEEPTHPRADNRYYKVTLGSLSPLPRPIPSRRLRRITFIPTTLSRLHQAEEINDLWIKSTAQERLWAALKQAGLEAERQYPLREDLPQYVTDFAFFCRGGRIALIVEDEPQAEDELREAPTPEYLLAAGHWTPLRVTRADLEADTAGWARYLAELVARSSGRTDSPDRLTDSPANAESCPVDGAGLSVLWGNE